MPTAPPSADDYKATPASRVESGEALFAIAPSGENSPFFFFSLRRGFFGPAPSAQRLFLFSAWAL